MSIFSDDKISVFNPYSLLEMVISVSASVNNAEEQASKNFIKSCQKTGKCVYDDTKIEQSIDSNINLLIQSYNDTDTQMKDWLKDISDEILYGVENESLKNILSEKPISIQHYPYLKYGFDLFDDFTQSVSKVKNDKDIKNCYNELLNGFEEKSAFKVMSNSNIYNFDFLNGKTEINQSTLKDVNKFVSDSMSHMNWYSNPAPDINADHYIRLKALKMISTYKAVLYSLYKAFITDYANINGRDLS